MLRLLLLPILLLVSTAAMAQGFTPWNPFPHKQITMWQKPDGSHDLHYNDSMRVNGNVKEHFFGLEQYTRDLLNCDSNLYSVYSRVQLLNTLVTFVPSVDSLTSEGDVIWRFANPNRPFELRTHEPINTSWGFRFVNGNVFDSISMTVINIDTASFLGYFDSLKTIRMETFRQGIATGSFWEYKVSRSAGMVQYIPFEQIIRNQTPETWIMMGFDHANGGHYGFTAHFEDYYGHFTAGDRYKWSFYHYAAPWTASYNYSGTRIDSIVSITRNSSGISLAVQRTMMKNGDFTVSNDTLNFDMSIEARLGFRRKNHTIINISDTAVLVYKHLLYPDTLSIGNTNNHIRTSHSTPLNGLHCSNTYCLSCYHTVASHAPYLGKVHYSRQLTGAGQEYNTLIGYQKAGQAPVGDMNRISGLGEVSSNPLRLFPNPAKNAVYLEGVSDNALVQVFDIHGKLMISTSYMLGAAIPTDDLNDGVYLVRVNDGANLLVSKLMIVK